MRVEDIKFTHPGLQTAGTLFTPDISNHQGVLFLHGHRSSQKGYAEYAEAVTSQLGATCLTLDLSGHGESSGDLEEISASQHLDEVQEALSYLSARPDVDNDRIGVVGASFGGYLATMACKGTPKKLLLRAPAIYDDSLFTVPRKEMSEEENNDFRRQLAVHLPPNMALDNLRNFDGPVTVVESEHDESILPSVIQAYLQVASHGTHKVIKGAGHSLKGQARADFKNIILDWAQDL